MERRARQRHQQGYIESEVTEHLLEGTDFAFLTVITVLVSTLALCPMTIRDQSALIGAFSLFVFLS